MLIHADFSKLVIIQPHQYQWIASPQPGVERVMLDRIGAEQARSTSLVRYAQSATFPAHQHPLGEEILVLSGTFSESGSQGSNTVAHYPAGYYLRSPHGSSHQASSQDGTVIFVKLRQMSPHDQQYIRINTHLAEAWYMEDGKNNQPAHAVCPLFQNDFEKVELRILQKNTAFSTDPNVLTEILILSGSLKLKQQQLMQGSWLRVPKDLSLELSVDSEDEAKLYIKTMTKIIIQSK